MHLDDDDNLTIQTSTAPASFSPSHPKITAIFAQHSSLLDLKEAALANACALCESEDRVVAEILPTAEGVENGDEISLPLCIDCARWQRAALGKGAWLAAGMGFLSFFLCSALLFVLPMPAVATALLFLLLHLSVFLFLLPKIKKRREEEVPFLILEWQRIQIPSFSPTKIEKAHIPRHKSRGLFSFTTLVSFLLMPMLWSAMNPPFLIDNPKEVPCTLRIDDQFFNLLPTDVPEIKTRLNVGLHHFALKCEGESSKNMTFEIERGRMWVFTTHENVCYSSSKWIVQPKDRISSPITYDRMAHRFFVPLLSTQLERIPCNGAED